VSSIEPDDGSCHVNGTKKRFCQLVIARGDRSILLELGKEILNQMPRFVQLLVVFTRVLAVALRRNHPAFALLLESLNHPLVRIISFVGSHRIGLNVFPQHIKSVKVIRLPRHQVEARGIAQRIDGRMNLGTQSAFAATNGLGVGIPPFAPALG